MKFPELTYATEDDPRWKQWAIRSVERLSGRNYFVPYYETWQRDVIPYGGPIIGPALELIDVPSNASLANGRRRSIITHR